MPAGPSPHLTDPAALANCKLQGIGQTLRNKSQRIDEVTLANAIWPYQDCEIATGYLALSYALVVSKYDLSDENRHC
jgi:hypothetical protein